MKSLLWEEIRTAQSNVAIHLSLGIMPGERLSSAAAHPQAAESLNSRAVLRIRYCRHLLWGQAAPKPESTRLGGL